MKRLFLSGLTSCVMTLLAAQSSGDALFDGKVALSGKIRGHDESLPPETVRCANCHEAQTNERLSRVAAPRLDRSLLLDARQRRGGPPSRYDQPAFCKLLKTGVDPAAIVIGREMPIYELDEGQCASLWTYLIGKEPAHAKH